MTHSHKAELTVLLEAFADSLHTMIQLLLVRVTFVAKHHDKKQVEEERVCLARYPESKSLEGSRGKKSN